MRVSRWLVVLLGACDLPVDVADPVRAPTATILSPTADSQVPSGPITFLGQVSDADTLTERLFTTWSIGPADGPLRDVCTAFAAPDGLVQCTTELEPSDGRVRLQVVDLAGYLGVALVDLVVRAVDAPVVELLAPSTQVAYASNAPVPLSARVTDADHAIDTLRVVWQSDVVGVLEGPTQPDLDGVLSGGVRLPEGEHTLSVAVTDPDGAVGRAEAIVYVGPPDDAPTVSWVAPATGAVVASDLGLTLDLRALDDDTPPEGLAITWTSDVDGSLASGAPDATGAARAEIDPLSPGPHLLSAEATDRRGFVGRATARVRVGERPQLTVRCPAPGQAVDVAQSGPYLEATVTDADGALDGVQVRLAIDGAALAEPLALSSAGKVAAVVSVPPDARSLTITAVDVDGLTDTVTRTFTWTATPGGACAPPGLPSP